MNPASDKARLEALAPLLERALAPERPALRRRWQGLARRVSRGEPIDRGLPKLAAALEASVARRTARTEHTPSLSFPGELPITAHVEEIRRALDEHPVLVVAGETGSGKTTQLPRIALLAGRGVDGLVGVTQPRRIAARSIAARVAEELGEAVGGTVGYQVRFDEKTSDATRVKIMTDGILLAETREDPELTAYDTLIIDEAHERSLNIDFLLGYLERLRARRPELRIVITSATIDTARFAAHFGDAPVLEVSGRSYPVEVRYRPLSLDAAPDEDDDRDLLTAIGDAVEELNREDAHGDVLVFLPGERDIRDAQDELENRRFRHTEILPLFARLSPAEQQRIFHPGPQRRIILATNVAETSLTVPRIRFVIDSGLARISRYSHRSKVQRLPIERVSRASADQRAGRCGRLGPGICVRLYAEEDYAARPEYTEPEILRVNLATVILQMEALKLGRMHDFPFIDPPDERQIRDGYQLLFELGALTAQQRLTALGRRLTRWPLDVRLARLVEAGNEQGCLAETMTLAAALSIQDPRVRPLEQQRQADEAHGQWADPKSDFVAWLKLWREYHETREDGSVRQLRQWCQASFLHFLRMREWGDVRRQLAEVARELGWRANERPAGYEAVHRALVTAFLGQLGLKTEDGYQGARDQRFHIFPGSGLYRRGPRWLVAAFLVETTRVYARENAAIDPSWAEAAGGHLVKRRVFDPYWAKRPGRVMGYEQVTLYGLPLVARRRIHYGPRDPVEARKLFILEALVRDGLGVDAPFAHHNRALVRRIERLEEKQRRRDLLVDEGPRCEFFNRRLPAGIHERRTFEAWRREAEQEAPRLLFYTEADLLTLDDHGVAESLYPDEIEIDGVRYAVTYRLEPGSPYDGVTLILPLARLGTLRPEPLEWLVPGYLKDKVTALIRCLPKTLRRHFVPAPDWARRFVDEVPFDRSRSLHGALAEYLTERSRQDVPVDAFELQRLAENLRMNLQLRDGEALVDAGRDLEALQAAHGERAREEFLEQAGQRFYEDGRRAWDFGPLPTRVDLDDGASAFPAVVDQGDAVGVRLFETAEEAAGFHRYGVRRLLELAAKDKVRYLQRQSGIDQTLCLQYAAVDTCDALKADFAFAVTLAVVAAREERAAGRGGGVASTERRRGASGPGRSRKKQVLGDLSDLEALRGELGGSARSREPVPAAAPAVSREASRSAGTAQVRDRGSFKALVEHARRRLLPLAAEAMGPLRETLTRYHALRQALYGGDLRALFPAAWEDLDAQLGHLVYARFLTEVPLSRLEHYPRYLRAIEIRLERLEHDPAADAARQARIDGFWQDYLAVVGTLEEARGTAASPVVGWPPALEALRWLLEEYRVSLFAQKLGTAEKASAKRLGVAWQAVQDSL